MSQDLHSTETPIPDKAWLIAAAVGATPVAAAEESLRELSRLATTAGAELLGESLCRIRDIHPGTYLGKGKLAELAEECKAAGANLIIFDEDLTPAQGRNLEAIFGIRILDRTQLILDIFAQHALTQEGRLQIELAQLQYLIPRLRGLWTHLERQKGGIGLKGPGEKQLELDRRRIEERITRIRKDLSAVRRRRAEMRRGRRRHGWALVTLVGYTNAGKSTLLNYLTQAGVLADDKLFATLDPTTRQLLLPNNQRCLLTDTVGFIRKLPHHLVESFKATLEEVNEADLLLHIIDTSHPRVQDQIAAVENVIRELGAQDKPVLAVLNKTDIHQAAIQAKRLTEQFAHSACISATTGEGTDALRQMIADLLRSRTAHLHLKIPAREGAILAMLHAQGNILRQTLEEETWILEAVVPQERAAVFLPFQAKQKRSRKERV